MILDRLMDRRQPLARRSPYFADSDPQRVDRIALGDMKDLGRDTLRRLGARPRYLAPVGSDSNGDSLVRYGRTRKTLESAPAAGVQTPPSRGKAVATASGSMIKGSAFGKPKLREPRCVTTFDANEKLTTISASAIIDVPVEVMIPFVDPRGWGLSKGVIDVAFRVIERNKAYEPFEDDLNQPLGSPWKGPNLLFEYARSEIASFENILAIDKFSVTPKEIYVEYRLVDCLKTIVGFLGVDGGLQRDDGFASVTAIDRKTSRIQVEKRIRVRDLTPNDPGNRYDFGQSVNSTIGAALSLWVDDISLMSPVF